MFGACSPRTPINGFWMQSALQGEPVRRFMEPELVAVKPEITVQDLVDNYIYKYHRKISRLSVIPQRWGCVSTAQVKTLARTEWSPARPSRRSSILLPQNTITPIRDAAKVFFDLSRAKPSPLLVVENGQLVPSFTSVSCISSPSSWNWKAADGKGQSWSQGRGDARRESCLELRVK